VGGWCRWMDAWVVSEKERWVEWSDTSVNKRVRG
jgi:hypothetical protein